MKGSGAAAAVWPRVQSNYARSSGSQATATRLSESEGDEPIVPSFQQSFSADFCVQDFSNLSTDDSKPGEYTTIYSVVYCDYIESCLAYVNVEMTTTIVSIDAAVGGSILLHTIYVHMILSVLVIGTEIFQYGFFFISKLFRFLLLISCFLSHQCS